MTITDTLNRPITAAEHAFRQAKTAYENASDAVVSAAQDRVEEIIRTAWPTATAYTLRAWTTDDDLPRLEITSVSGHRWERDDDESLEQLNEDAETALSWMAELGFTDGSVDLSTLTA